MHVNERRLRIWNTACFHTWNYIMIFQSQDDVIALKHIGLTVSVLVGVMATLILTSIVIGSL